MPSNVFSTRQEAEAYIKKHKLEKTCEIVVWKDRNSVALKYSVLSKLRKSKGKF